MSRARRLKKLRWKLEDGSGRSPRDWRLVRRVRRRCVAEHWGPEPPRLELSPWRHPYNELCRVAFVGPVRCRSRKCGAGRVVVPVVVTDEETLYYNSTASLAAAVRGRVESAAVYVMELVATRAKRRRWVQYAREVVSRWSPPAL